MTLPRARASRSGSASAARVAGHIDDHAAALLRFTGDDASGHLGQRHRFQLDVLAADAGLREGEQFVHEFRHVAQFLAHVGHVIALTFIRPLVEDAEGHFHAGQRRAKLVGDVAEEALLPGEEFAQTRGHVVERAAEPAEFVGAPGVHLASRSGPGRWTPPRRSSAAARA